jgi:RIO kinase 1
LQSLIDEGLIDSVVRQLMSGKEADGLRGALRRRNALRQGLQGSHKRSFRQAVDYTENRKVKNTARRAPWPRARASAGR